MHKNNSMDKLELVPTNNEDCEDIAEHLSTNTIKCDMLKQVCADEKECGSKTGELSTSTCKEDQLQQTCTDKSSSLKKQFLALLSDLKVCLLVVTLDLL